MQEKGWRIGAENSGHVILLDKPLPVTALLLACRCWIWRWRNHMSLHGSLQRHENVPQILVNVRYTAGSGDPLEHESVVL